MGYRLPPNQKFEILLNKVYDGGIASTQSVIILPKNNTANLDAIRDQEGTIAYDTTLQEVVIDKGNGFVAIGGANSTLSNLVSPTAINQDLIFDTGLAAVIKTEDTITGATLGLSVLSGNSPDDASGPIIISSGTSVGQNSGQINITTGIATSSAESGQLQISTGDGDTTSGSLAIFTGAQINPAAGAPSGAIGLSTGSNAGTAGSGNISLNTAATSTGNGNSGSVTINTGDSDNGNSGNISLTPGVSISGTSGKIVLADTASVGTVGHIWTSTDINGGGAWQAAPAGGSSETTVVDTNFSGIILHKIGRSVTVDINSDFYFSTLQDGAGDPVAGGSPGVVMSADNAIPISYRPDGQIQLIVHAKDNSIETVAQVLISDSGQITLSKLGGNTFSGDGAVEMYRQCFSYLSVP